MKIKTLTVRELARNMKQVSSAVARGQSFMVLRNTKPIFRIEPVVEGSDPEKPLTLADLKKIQFASAEKDLSKKIDEAVYGV